MEHYRRTAHTRFDIKYHLVWHTKYRKRWLREEVAIRLRQIVRDICSELEMEIIKGNIGKEHVHLFVSCIPQPAYATDQEEEFQEIVTGIQPPEATMLGPASMGTRVFRSRFQEHHR